MTELHEQEILKLYAELGKSFNSYYELPCVFEDWIRQEKLSLLLNNQFLPVRMKYPENSLQVASWTISKDFATGLENLLEVHWMGELAAPEQIEFYLPMDLIEVFPEITQKLGRPHRIHPSVLTSSGRSLWVFPEKQSPLCLKIDTGDILLPKKFSSRILTKAQIGHAVTLNEYLGGDPFIFNETGGLSLRFEPRKGEDERNYTYLIRRLDFQRCDIDKDDFLIPLQTLLSRDFWKNQNLLQALGLAGRRPAEFMETDLANGFARMIMRGFEKTFLHYEIHQQNLTVHLRNGKLIKLLYHDLTDAVFDPVSFLLSQEIQSLTDLKRATHQIDQIHAQPFFNSQGLWKIPKATLFTVTSLYRRYFRNFGDYPKIYNFFSGEDYVHSRKYEEIVLNALRSQLPDLGDRPTEYSFLSKELFWTLERWRNEAQKRKLNEKYAMLESMKESPSHLDEKFAEEFVQKAQRVRGYRSHLFPFEPSNLQVQDFSEIHRLLNGQIYVGVYRGSRFLVIFESEAMGAKSADSQLLRC